MMKIRFVTVIFEEDLPKLARKNGKIKLYDQYRVLSNSEIKVNDRLFGQTRNGPKPVIVIKVNKKTYSVSYIANRLIRVETKTTKRIL